MKFLRRWAIPLAVLLAVTAAVSVGTVVISGTSWADGVRASSEGGLGRLAAGTRDDGALAESSGEAAHTGPGRGLGAGNGGGRGIHGAQWSWLEVRSVALKVLAGGAAGALALVGLRRRQRRRRARRAPVAT